MDTSKEFTINRKEFSTFVINTAAAFDGLEFSKCVPENIRNEAIKEVIDSLFRALTILNRKRPAGEIKTSILNDLKKLTGIDVLVNKTVTIEEWELAAYKAYCTLYSARSDTHKLACGASRIVRGYDIFKPLPNGITQIHYVPNDEIVERTLENIKSGKFGEISTPTHAEDFTVLDLDGVPVYENGLFPLTITEIVKK